MKTEVPIMDWSLSESEIEIIPDDFEEDESINVVSDGDDESVDSMEFNVSDWSGQSDGPPDDLDEEDIVAAIRGISATAAAFVANDNNNNEVDIDDLYMILDDDGPDALDDIFSEFMWMADIEQHNRRTVPRLYIEDILRLEQQLEERVEERMEAHFQQVAAASAPQPPEPNPMPVEMMSAVNDEPKEPIED